MIDFPQFLSFKDDNIFSCERRKEKIRIKWEITKFHFIHRLFHWIKIT